MTVFKTDLEKPAIFVPVTEDTGKASWYAVVMLRCGHAKVPVSVSAGRARGKWPENDPGSQQVPLLFWKVAVVKVSHPLNPKN